MLLSEGMLCEDAGISASDVVRSSSWIPQWIPIGQTNAGADLCVDLSPGPAGTSGQWIETESAVHPRLYGGGFEAYLQWLTRALSSGAVLLDGDKRRWV